MNVRYAVDKDIDDIKEIWNYCFGDTEKFVDYYFSNRYLKEKNVVVEQNGKVISSLQMAPYNINLNGKEYKTSYIVGVSTLPEARGKGSMKSMMDFSLEEMYKNGEKVSILMPIDYRIYRRYGYEHCYDQIQYNFDINDLNKFRIKGNFHKSNKDHIDALIEIADTFQKDLNGNPIRDEEYYINLAGEVESDDGSFYIYENDGFKGYLIYAFNGDNMFVREIFYKDIEALKSMLGFIYNHNTQCKTVTISAPVADKIRLLLANPKDADIKLLPFMMGRVINIKSYLEGLEPLNSDIKATLNLRVIDEQIKENNKIFKIVLDDGNIEVEEDNTGNADIELSVNALTQMIFSYITFEEVLSLYEIDIDLKAKNKAEILFNALFDKKDNYVNDYI